MHFLPPSPEAPSGQGQAVPASGSEALGSAASGPVFHLVLSQAGPPSVPQAVLKPTVQPDSHKGNSVWLHNTQFYFPLQVQSTTKLVTFI